MTSDTRYTVDEVLAILDRIGQEFELHGPKGWSPALRLKHWGEWEGLFAPSAATYLEFLSALADMFAFEASSEEWRPLAKGDTTVAQLAEFIAERAPRVEIKPLRVLGRECLEAGLFEVLADDVRRLTGNDLQFGPSTVISDVMDRRQRTRLVWRLALLLPRVQRTPDLFAKSPFGPLFGWCFGALWLFAIGGAALLRSPAWIPAQTVWNGIGVLLTGLALWLIPVVALLALACCVYPALTKHRGPFHQDIRTFRDLVKALKNGLARPAPRADGEV